MVGAGPGGLTAAFHAAKKGYDVKVYEKETKLAKKPCGEATLGSIAHLTPFTKFGSQDFILSKFDKALIYRDGRYAARLRIPADCFMLDKSMFLEEFSEALGGYGVEIFRGKICTRVASASYDDPETLLIDASGFIRSSPFAIKCSPDVVPILRGYTKRNGVISNDEILIDVADGGYFWIFPYGHRYNVGFGGEFPSSEVRKRFAKYLADYRLELVSGIDGAGLCSGGPKKKLISPEGIRLVGESASMVNPGTGEGIRFAMYAGSICLEDDYEEKFWTKYGKNLRRSLKIGKAVLSLSRDDLEELLSDASPDLVIALFDGKVPKPRDVMRLLWKNPGLVKKMVAG